MGCDGYGNRFNAVLAGLVLFVGSAASCTSSANAAIDHAVTDMTRSSVVADVSVTVMPIEQLLLMRAMQLSNGIECATLDQIQALGMLYFESSDANRASGWYAYLAGCREFRVESFIIDTREPASGISSDGLLWQIHVLGVHQPQRAGFVPY
jgi:hypothetical protein